MNKQKKAYCIDTLSNRFGTLSPEQLAAQAIELLSLVDETILETLMRQYGESPDAYLLPRKDEIFKAIENVDEIEINVVYEDYRDDYGTESFARLEDKELLTDAIALAISLEENGEDEEALRLLAAIHKLDFDFRFYDEYDDEPMDYDSRSFVDVSSLLPNGIEAKRAFLRLIIKCGDYESACFYFENYHPGREELDCVTPAFADAFLTFVETNAIRIDDRFGLLKSLLDKIDEQKVIEHAKPLGSIYPTVLTECLKLVGNKVDLRPVVESYLSKDERIDYLLCNMLRAAIERYPGEEAYIRRYYLGSHEHNLDAMFLFLSLPNTAIEEIKEEDQVFFKTDTLASYYDFEQKCRLLSLFFIGPETKDDDPLGEMLYNGQARYLTLAHFDVCKLLDLVEKDLINQTSGLSSKHYRHVALDAVKLNAAVNGSRDFVKSLLDAFPKRPSLRKALLECVSQR